MDIVRVVRVVVDQQMRPGQRGTTVLAYRMQHESSLAAVRFLNGVDADGQALKYALYGRGRYGQERLG